MVSVSTRCERIINNTLSIDSDLNCFGIRCVTVRPPRGFFCRLVRSRDVNEDPISTNPWGIPLLGYGYETKIIPMGINMGQNLHPLDKRVWVWEAITRTQLPMGILYVYTCHVCMNKLMPSRPPSPARQRTKPQVLAQQGN
jgi:hypothetical protein